MKAQVRVLLAYGLFFLCTDGFAQQSDTNAGKKLFGTKLCQTCHSLEEGKTLVGPSLAHIASRVSRAFLTKQLKDPQANFKNTSVSKSKKAPASLMPKPVLTDKEFQELLDYLMTLK